MKWCVNLLLSTLLSIDPKILIKTKLQDIKTYIQGRGREDGSKRGKNVLERINTSRVLTRTSRATIIDEFLLSDPLDEWLELYLI